MVYVWLIVIALSLIVEASTATLVAIWFIPSAIISAVIAKLGGDLVFQSVVFLLLSIVCILLGRRLLSKRLKGEYVPTNADSLIGETALVEEDIDLVKSCGLVKVKGQTWSAASENSEIIEKGKQVEILAIRGVKLIVKERN